MVKRRGSMENRGLVADLPPQSQMMIELETKNPVKREEREQNVPVLEPELGAEESETAPHVIQAGSIREFLQRASGKQSVSIPEEGLLQQWEAQWQEFLKTLESPCSGWEAPPSPTQPSPWEDTKAFLASFEQVARACQWPREEWMAHLRPALNGEAKEVFLGLEAEDREDFGKVKVAILREDVLTREKKRQQFRQFSYQPADGPRRVYNHLQELCNQWLKVEKLSKEQVLEQLVLEQFLAVLPLEVQNQLREHGPETSAQAVAMAEDFLLRQPEAEGWEQQIQNNPQAPRESGLNLPETEQISQVPEQEAELEDPCEEINWEIKSPMGPVSLSADPVLNNPLTEHQTGCPPGELSMETEPKPSQITEPDVSQGHKQGGTSGSLSGLMNEARNPKMKLVVRLNEAHLGIEGGKVNLLSSLDTKILKQKVPCVKLLSLRLGQMPYKCSEQCEQGETPRCSDETAAGAKKSSKKKAVKKLKGAQGSKKGNASPLSTKKACHIQATNIQMRGRPFQCPDCGKSFAERSYLRKHERIHSGEKPYKCPYCERTFRDRSHLKKHARLHTGEKPYKCKDCGKTFRQTSNLGKHLQMHIGEPVYRCSDCGKNFRQQSKFYQHRKVHTAEKNLSCTQCGESFNQASLLHAHQKTHVAEQGFKCPVCGKIFRYRSSFVKHELTHTGEKPYACPTCGKRFNQSSNLHKHQKIHTGVKPFKCNTCGKSFIQASHLSLHLNTHKGFKTFKCLDCGDSFTDRSHLMKHKLTHTAGKQRTSA